VTKPLVPDGGGGGGMEGGCHRLQRVEGTGAVTSDDLSPRGKSLHRTAKRVKFHRTVIVGGKLANRNKVLNKIRGNQNIIKKKIMR
jgi:hypothetical protein